MGFSAVGHKRTEDRLTNHRFQRASWQSYIMYSILETCFCQTSGPRSMTNASAVTDQLSRDPQPFSANRLQASDRQPPRHLFLIQFLDPPATSDLGSGG